jgi:hypothetical protein
MFRRPSNPDLPRLPGYEVQRVPGFQARKAYVCPTCGNHIPAGRGHIVAWPDDQVEARRHWHLHCWRLVAVRGRL